MSERVPVARSGILRLECPDTVGVVAAVAALLADRDITISEAQQFNDGRKSRFFMRALFRSVSGELLDLDALREAFAPICERFAMVWDIDDAGRAPRVLIGVSRHGHCLFELINAWRAGALPIEIAGVFSNHEDMRSFTEWQGLAYHCLPAAPATRADQEARLLELAEDGGADLLVLARYMQILSPSLCARFAGRCINIHHSFLPAFKGARPYHQAHSRGVKIIGATAHYVTDKLDE
ncbi:MAG: formyltetrahydrofolate deformylase, partial [Caulobacteraceae bacterium]